MRVSCMLPANPAVNPSLALSRSLSRADASICGTLSDVSQRPGQQHSSPEQAEDNPSRPPRPTPYSPEFAHHQQPKLGEVAPPSTRQIKHTIMAQSTPSSWPSAHCPSNWQCAIARLTATSPRCLRSPKPA